MRKPALKPQAPLPGLGKPNVKRFSGREWQVIRAHLASLLAWLEATQERCWSAYQRNPDKMFWETYRYYGNVVSFVKGELGRVNQRLRQGQGVSYGEDRLVGETF